MAQRRDLVLIANNDQAVRDALQFALQLEGFCVHVHSGGAALLQDPDARLVNLTQGPDTVCTPLDLQLSVATFAGMREPLIATHLSKLTPEQVAAIPKKYLPY